MARAPIHAMAMEFVIASQNSLDLPATNASQDSVPVILFKTIKFMFSKVVRSNFHIRVASIVAHHDELLTQ